MIDRIVLLKLKDEHATPERRAEVAAETKKVMSTVEGVLDVRVGLPADEASASSWDLSIIVRLADVEMLGPYARDKAHRALVDDVLKPRLEVIKAWNFEAH